MTRECLDARASTSSDDARGTARVGRPVRAWAFVFGHLVGLGHALNTWE